MKSPLHILHLEDDPTDAALIQACLEAGGVTCAVTAFKTGMTTSRYCSNTRSPPSAPAHKLRAVLEQPDAPPPNAAQKTLGFTNHSEEAKPPGN